MSLTVYGRNPVMNVTIQMKPLQRHFFCMVLGVPFESVDEILKFDYKIECH